MQSDIPETLHLTRTNLQDEYVAIYMDRPAAFVVAVPVLNERYGLAVWLEKGSGEMYGFPTILSVKIMLRSLCKRTKAKEARSWYWQLGPLSPRNIKLERNNTKVSKGFGCSWNNFASYALYEYLKEWNLLEMVEDYYVPVKGPIDMAIALASARNKYEEVLTALTQAVITGLDLPEPNEDE